MLVSLIKELLTSSLSTAVSIIAIIADNEECKADILVLASIYTLLNLSIKVFGG